MAENTIGLYVSALQLAILTIGVVTVIVKLGKREALIESNAEELKQLKEITKDLVKADIENSKNILTVVGDLNDSLSLVLVVSWLFFNNRNIN
jgi:hypothetical protein